MVKFQTLFPMLKLTLLGCTSLVLLLSCVSNDIQTNKALNLKAYPFKPINKLKTPRLSSTENTLLLSWVETSSSIKQLKYSMYDNKQWSEAKTAAFGANWFINYADFAKVEAVDDQHFIASWLEQTSRVSTQYQFKIKQSFDAGKTWLATTSPLAINDGERGFISAVKVDDNVIFTWISQVGDAYQIHSSMLNANNQWSDTLVVDNASCSCCHTDMAAQGNRALTVYRDRTKNEIRDIAISSFQHKKWQAPKVIHHDGWEINGCPVNGPSISANDDSLAIIWYTFAKNIPQVKLLTQLNSSLNKVTVLDEKGIGYVDSAMVNYVTVILSWLALTDELSLNMQTVSLLNGSLGAKMSFKINQETLGFPSITVFDEQLFVANESDRTGIQIQNFELNKFSP